MSKAILAFLFLFSVSTFAVEEKAATQATESSSKSNHDFEDLLVQGKYHFSDDAVSTVEEDKVLDSLIGVRQDFKDKIENSDSQF